MNSIQNNVLKIVLCDTIYVDMYSCNNKEIWNATVDWYREEQAPSVPLEQSKYLNYTSDCTLFKCFSNYKTNDSHFYQFKAKYVCCAQRFERDLRAQIDFKQLVKMSDSCIVCGQVEQISQMTSMAEAILEYHQQCTEIMRTVVENLQEKWVEELQC